MNDAETRNFGDDRHRDLTLLASVETWTLTRLPDGRLYGGRKEEGGRKKKNRVDERRADGGMRGRMRRRTSESLELGGRRVGVGEMG